MTQFDITYTDFKREDTTNDITIKLYADNKRPIIPDASHTWKAKVAKGDKYVGEYPVTIFGNVIKLSSSNLTRLPDGIYALELWETYDGSTAIYPSTGVMEFRVHENIDDTLGTIDPTTDINAIIDDLHKAGQNIKVVATNTLPAGSKASVTQSITNGENQLTFYIPQGDKGEKGDVGPAPTLKIGTVTKLDPDQTPTASFSGGNGSYTLDLGIPQGVQGETNPTATQALDIAKSVDSKVNDITSNGGGRNLIANTGTDIVVDATSDSAGNWELTKLYFTEQPKQGDLITVSAEGTLTGTGTLSEYEVILFDNSTLNPRSQAQYLKAGKRDSVTLSLDNLNGSGNTTLLIYAGKGGETQGKKNVVHHLMVEKGTVAHDWQPAPEDIQSEIDALKEAVKKLGGTI
ncbi:hypothetical protein H0G69_06340 [Limosilactobacillus mucosae]|uniref:hypothetical protein n=1 Tax=Limosilactobacillus mucosae TaxID=97478 RepID=UPI0015D56EED|nr:hypothetical protein [Limosilactobacillus mucosae]QLI94568.1 hypothetical protein H0G69_06340 [Limosilactobacillus mucosae]